MKYVPLIIIFWIITTNVIAQDACKAILTEAKSEYANGLGNLDLALKYLDQVELCDWRNKFRKERQVLRDNIFNAIKVQKEKAETTNKKLEVTLDSLKTTKDNEIRLSLRLRIHRNKEERLAEANQLMKERNFEKAKQVYKKIYDLSQDNQLFQTNLLFRVLPLAKINYCDSLIQIRNKFNLLIEQGDSNWIGYDVIRSNRLYSDAKKLNYDNEVAEIRMLKAYSYTQRQTTANHTPELNSFDIHLILAQLDLMQKDTFSSRQNIEAAVKNNRILEPNPILDKYIINQVNSIKSNSLFESKEIFLHVNFVPFKTFLFDQFVMTTKNNSSIKKENIIFNERYLVTGLGIHFLKSKYPFGFEWSFDDSNKSAFIVDSPFTKKITAHVEISFNHDFYLKYKFDFFKKNYALKNRLSIDAYFGIGTTWINGKIQFTEFDNRLAEIDPDSFSKTLFERLSPKFLFHSQFKYRIHPSNSFFLFGDIRYISNFYPIDLTNEFASIRDFKSYENLLGLEIIMKQLNLGVGISYRF